jgi:hypothetical protein
MQISKCNYLRKLIRISPEVGIWMRNDFYEKKRGADQICSLFGIP